MVDNSRELEAGFPGVPLRITGQHLFLIVLVMTSILSALVLIRSPEKYQMVIILLIPASVALVLILKNPYIGIYLYFLYNFLRPYDFIPALQPLKLAMVIEIVTLISWVGQVVISKERIKWTHFHWLFLGFLVVIAVTVVTANNNRSAYDVFEAMLIVFIMFVISTNVVNSDTRINKLIWLLLVIHFYFASRGMYNYFLGQHVSGGMQTSGAVGSSFIGDENDFALALNVMIPFAFFMLGYSRSRLKKVVSIGLLSTFMIAIVCSFSRGGWVGLVAVTVFCIMKSKRKAAAFGYVALFSLLLVAVAPKEYWHEIQTISDTKETTAVTRFRYWAAAGRMYLDHPIIGVGAGNGGTEMPNYIAGVEDPGREWGRAFHGTIPEILAELGTFGLLLYLLMILYTFKLLIITAKGRTKADDRGFGKYAANSIMGAMIAYFACATFLSTGFYPQFWTLYTLAAILVIVKRSENTKMLERRDVGFSTSGLEFSRGERDI